MKRQPFLLFITIGTAVVSLESFASVDMARGTHRTKPIHLSATFSEEAANPDNLAFDVSGVSAGLGLDLIPGRLNGIQIAALFAGVESYRGLQMGGLASMSGAGKGIQASVFGNLIHDRFEGLQLGGWVNAASGAGAQISIIENRTDDRLNLTDAFRIYGRQSEWRGIQMAGICNFSCYLDGIQMSLFYNSSVRCRGAQLAMINDVEELQGIQIGLLNKAKSGSGVQIGFINVFGSSPELLAVPLVYLHF